MQQAGRSTTLPGGAQAVVTSAAKNVYSFLDFALSAALDGLAQRRLDLAVADMMRAYAFLLSAYEKPCETAYIPSLWTILRTYDLVSQLGNDREVSN